MAALPNLKDVWMTAVKACLEAGPTFLVQMAEHLREICILAFFTNSKAWYTDPSSFRISILSPKLPWENV